MPLAFAWEDLAMLPAPNSYPEPDERDREIFDATVPRDHYLRRVLEVLDFASCRDDLVSCYSDHLGRPAKEPVLLLKLEFLEYHYNLSDRQVVEQAQYNMAFRFFLDLSLKSPLPHHTLFTKFRERLGSAKHQKVFDNFVAQARAHGLVKDRLRLKDATHVLANIAIPSTVRLLADTRRQLLEALRRYAPERVALEEAQAAQIHATTADLSGEERLLQRVTHLRSIVAWVETLVYAGAGRDEPAWWTLTEALQLAHKVLADREPKAEDRLVSLQDQDARWGEHHVYYAGYLLDIALDGDSSLITAINVLPANGNEVEDATTLIKHEEQVHGNDVQTLSIDAIASRRGESLRQWTDPAGLNLEVIVPPNVVAEAPDGFKVEQFTPSTTGETMTCPAGQTSNRHIRNRHDTGWVFRFERKLCASCPLLDQCMKQLPRSKGRQVATNDYAAEYAATAAKAQTPRYREIRRQHRQIERKLGEMVRWHRGRRARYRGRAKVLLQSLLTGLVVNVKRVVRLLTTPRVRAGVAASG